MTPRVLVFGLGQPDRGDDAVGPRVVEQVAEQVAEPVGARAGRPGVIRTGTGTEPLTLLDLLAPGDALVLVDAVRTGAGPGTVLLRDLVTDPLPATGAPASGHLIGLDQVLALARSLDRLTGPVVLVGVEAAGFDHGAGLSPAVAAALPAAVGTVLAVLAALPDGGPHEHDLPAGRIGGCR